MGCPQKSNLRDEANSRLPPTSLSPPVTGTPLAEPIQVATCLARSESHSPGAASATNLRCGLGQVPAPWDAIFSSVRWHTEKVSG